MKLLLLPLFVILGITAQKLSLDEAQAISDVAKSLMVSFITISVENPKQETAKALKSFSDNGIAISVQQPDKVSEIVKESKPEFPTIILLRPKHFKQIFFVNDPKPRHSLSKVETRQRLKRDHWSWILLLQPGEDFLEEGEIPFSVEFVILEPIPNGFNVWEQYHIYVNRPGQKTESVRTLMARWFPDTRLENEFKSTGLVASPRNMFSRRDMKNSTLVVRQCFFPQRNRLLQKLAKIPAVSVAVVEAMRLIFNFKEVVIDRSQGFDIEACDISILHYSEPPTEIWKWTIGPLMKFKVSLYYAEPPVRPLENYALEPFEPEVWAVLAAWIIIAAFCVRLVHFTGKFTASESIFQVVEAFFGQGNAAEGETNPARMINAAIWFTVIAVTASYSAIILTFIMIRKPNIPFNNMDEFVKDGTYNYSGIPMGITETAHEMFPEDSAVKEAYRKHKMPAANWTFFSEQGVDLMCKNSKIAFLQIANHLEMDYWPCPIKRMRDSYFECDMAVRSRPILPYVVAFNEKLPLLWSSGVLSIITRDFYSITFQRSEPVVPPPGIDLLKHVLLIVPAAGCIAVFILALEILHKTLMDHNIGLRLPKCMNTV